MQTKSKWHQGAIEALQAGESIQIRPRGHSMSGKINDGDLVTIEPCNAQTLAVGDIVFARVKGCCCFHFVLHLILKREAERFLIGSNSGRVDGWIVGEDIFGKATQIDPTDV